MSDREKRILLLLRRLDVDRCSYSDFAPNERPDLEYAEREGLIEIVDHQPAPGDTFQPKFCSITNKGRAWLSVKR